MRHALNKLTPLLFLLATLAAPALYADEAAAKKSDEHKQQCGQTLSTPSEASGQQVSVTTEKDYELSFFSEEQARLRAALAPQDESDIDARLFINAELGERSGRFKLNTSLGLWADLDTVPASDKPSALREIHDGRKSPLWLDVYSLQAIYTGQGLLHSARLGRIVVDHGLPRSIDGGELQLELLPRWLGLHAYGGQSVHFFEVEPGLFEDWIAALGLHSQPLRNMRVEIEAELQRENTLEENNLYELGYGAKLWYRLPGWLDARGYLRGIDDRLSHAGGALRLRWPQLGLSAELRLRSQLIKLKALTESEDPYFSILGEAEPFVRARFDSAKTVTTNFGDYAIHFGLEARQLIKARSSNFNRNFAYAYTALSAQDIVVSGPWARLALERQAISTDFAGSNLSGHGFWTVSGSLGYTRAALRAELGSRYDAYKYTYYHSVDEQQNVQSYFANFGYRFSKKYSLRVRYLYEHFAWDVHSFTLSFVQVF